MGVGWWVPISLEHSLSKRVLQKNTRYFLCWFAEQGFIILLQQSTQQFLSSCVSCAFIYIPILLYKTPQVSLFRQRSYTYILDYERTKRDALKELVLFSLHNIPSHILYLLKQCLFFLKKKRILAEEVVNNTYCRKF